MSSKRISVDYDFTPQMKRLSFDEAKEYKQSVYDKTIRLLYEGAKLDPKGQSPVLPCTPSKNAANSERKHYLKQILLNNKCQLDSTQTIFNPKEYCPTVIEKCAFCERLNCFTSLYQCDKCQEYYCNKCSLSTYTDKEELPLCLTCFK